MEETDFLYDIGYNVKMFRLSKNITISDLYKSTKISKTYIYKFEQGKKKLDLKKLTKIMHALNMTAMDFKPVEPKVIPFCGKIKSNCTGSRHAEFILASQKKILNQVQNDNCYRKEI